MRDIKLYHGSKTGISGGIRPSSRRNCDFGSGFYMGTDPMQAKSLVSLKRDAVFYELNLKLSQIPEENILVLDGKDWLNHVMYNRGRFKELSDTEFYQNIVQAELGKDIIIGPIADDKMNPVLWSFGKGFITDTVVMESIKCVDYGLQYVAKTDRACSCIEILKAEHMTEQDCKECEAYRKLQKQISETLLPKIQIKYRNQGLYYDQLVDRARNSELVLTEDDLKNLNDTETMEL